MPVMPVAVDIKMMPLGAKMVVNVFRYAEVAPSDEETVHLIEGSILDVLTLIDYQETFNF